MKKAKRTARKFKRLKNTIIWHHVEQSFKLPNQRGKRRKVNVKNVRCLGEIAPEATHSLQDQVFQLEFQLGDEITDRQTICMRYGSSEALFRRRLELQLAEAMGTMRITEELQSKSGANGDVDTHSNTSPFNVAIIKTDGSRCDIPPINQWAFVVSCRNFVPNAESCLAIMLRQITNTCNTDADLILIDAIAKKLASIHQVVEDLTDDDRIDLYYRGRQFILGRIAGWHNVELGKHGLLSKEEGRMLHCLISESIHNGRGKPCRLRSVWGDAHFGNFLRIRDGSVIAIDPRVRADFGQAADPGLDVGFLLVDLWWFYRVCNNPIFRERAVRLLDTYIRITGDTKIRCACLEWGVPWRIAMRLRAPYVKPSELAKARPFVEDMVAWMSDRKIDLSL